MGGILTPLVEPAGVLEAKKYMICNMFAISKAFALHMQWQAMLLGKGGLWDTIIHVSNGLFDSGGFDTLDKGCVPSQPKIMVGIANVSLVVSKFFILFLTAQLLNESLMLFGVVLGASID